MSDEKGFLSKQEERRIADFLDDLFNFKKLKGFAWKFVEMVDGKIFLSGIIYLDDTLAEKIPAGLKAEASLFIKAVLAGDEKLIISHGTHLLNRLIDIPVITEESEAILIGSVVEGIVRAIMAVFEKNPA